MGAPFLLQALGVANASAYLFLALGLAFGAAWYFGGLGLVLPVWLGLSSDVAAPIFLGALAIGFSIVFLVDPERRALLVPAALLAAVALLTLFGRGDLMPGWFQPMFVPLLFIALGAYLLLETRPQ